MGIVSYEIRIDAGTLLAESVDDRREKWLQIVSPWITGAHDRAARNADTIGTTLHRVKALAEASQRTARCVNATKVASTSTVESQPRRSFGE